MHSLGIHCKMFHAHCAHIYYRQAYFAYLIVGLHLYYAERQNAGISATAPKLTLSFLVKVKKSGG